jgi:hypothetical protein
MSVALVAPVVCQLKVNFLPSSISPTTTVKETMTSSSVVGSGGGSVGGGVCVATGVLVGGGSVGTSVADSKVSATSGCGAFGVLEGVGGIEVGTNTWTAVGAAGVDAHANEAIIKAMVNRTSKLGFFIKNTPVCG